MRPHLEKQTGFRLRFDIYYNCIVHYLSYYNGILIFNIVKTASQS